MFMSAPKSTCSTTRSMSGGEASTTAGDLPPHSSVTSLRLDSAEYWRNSRPTSVEPVNVTLSTSMWRPSAAPASPPGPGTTFSTPSGSPASAASSARRITDSDVSRDGLTIIEFPVARAGAIFQAAMRIGKFQGTTAPTTPTGSRTISPSASGPGRRDGIEELVGRLRVPGERLDRLRQVDLAGVGDRLAALERIERRELLRCSPR